MAPGAGGDSDEGVSSGDVAALEQQLAQLRAEVAGREAQARQAGFQEGETAAADKLTQPLRQAAANLGASIRELAELRPKLRKDAEEELVRLAVAIARKVIHRELTADPHAILGIVKAALEKLDARDILRIHVHPDDVVFIEQALSAQGAPDKVEVLADTGLERGGLIVETSRGNLDASVESQLQEIERGFVDLVRRSGS